MANNATPKGKTSRNETWLNTTIGNIVLALSVFAVFWLCEQLNLDFIATICLATTIVFAITIIVGPENCRPP